MVSRLFKMEDFLFIFTKLKFSLIEAIDNTYVTTASRGVNPRDVLIEEGTRLGKILFGDYKIGTRLNKYKTPFFAVHEAWIVVSDGKNSRIFGRDFFVGNYKDRYDDSKTKHLNFDPINGRRRCGGAKDMNTYLDPERFYIFDAKFPSARDILELIDSEKKFDVSVIQSLIPNMKSSMKRYDNKNENH
jgi:hypothetical protein